MKPTTFVLSCTLACLCASSTFAETIPFSDPTVTTVDEFGSSLAVEGDLLLIGAPSDDTAANNVGQAYLFDAVSNTLLRTFNDPSFTIGDNFAASVAISGSRVLIGAPGGAAGQAFLFDRFSGNLLQTYNDPSLSGSSDFGSAVALDGDRVLIGAGGDDSVGTNIGRAYLFDAASASSTPAPSFTFNDPTPTTADGFGSSLAISGDRIVIGAPGDDTLGLGIGQAHVFDASNPGSGSVTLNDPTPTTFDEFGTSVAIEGNRVVVSAPSDDTITVNAGQAHLFDGASGGVLAEFNDPVAIAFDRFGSSVAIEGGRVLVGIAEFDTFASNAGRALLFDALTGAAGPRLAPPTDFISGSFGAAVSLSGGRAIIGAPGDDTDGANVGRAFLFAVPLLVPEPTTGLLACLACLGLTASRRARR